MDIASFSRRESMLNLREQLVAVEEERLSGEVGYSLDDAITLVEQSVSEVIEDK